MVPAFPTAEAKPVLLIVAIDRSDDDQETPFVMSVTVPSLKRPVAENCWDPWLTVIEGLAGLISIETRGELVIVTVVDPVIPLSLAEIVAEPGAMVVATPLSLINSTLTFEVVQTGDFSTPVLPSTYVADAVNCCLKPVSNEGAGGVTVIDAIGMSQKPSQDKHQNESESRRAQCNTLLATIATVELLGCTTQMLESSVRGCYCQKCRSTRERDVGDGQFFPKAQRGSM